MRAAPGLVAMLVGACHVTTRTELSHTRAARSEPRTALARPLAPTLAIGDGALRLIEPLTCPSEDLVEIAPEVQRVRGPNIATFVVGVIATVAGGVALASTVGDATGTGPRRYAGGALAAVGIPFAIGPWIGNGVDAQPLPPRIERRPGADVPCGERGLGPGAALVAIGPRQVFAAVDGDGVLATSPFSWIDAFDPTGGPAFAAHVERLDAAGQPVGTIDKVFEAGAFAAWRDGFLASAHVDATVEPLRALPRITVGEIRLGRVRTPAAAVLHVVLPMANAGPGEAWQVRAVLAADEPELDGRIVYVGHVPARGAATGEAWLPLSPRADRAIGRGTVEVTFRLVDAHGTMPEPIPYRGTVADDGDR